MGFAWGTERTRRSTEGFEKEAFGGLSIACRTQEKCERVSFRIHCARERRPDFLDVDGRLIHFPRIIAGFQVRPTAFFQLWSIVLDEST
jgi:hypothetical protein